MLLLFQDLLLCDGAAGLFLSHVIRTSDDNFGHDEYLNVQNRPSWLRKGSDTQTLTHANSCPGLTWQMEEVTKSWEMDKHTAGVWTLRRVNCYIRKR